MSFFTRKASVVRSRRRVRRVADSQRRAAAQDVEADAKAAAEEAAARGGSKPRRECGEPESAGVRSRPGDLDVRRLRRCCSCFLSIFAWPQIAAALDERERKITDNIAAAEARLEDAKRLLAEHEAKLAAAAGEVRALLEEARRDAEHTRRSIEAEGHKAAKDELDRAVREIDRARDAAIQDLAVASANVAIDLARKCRAATEISRRAAEADRPRRARQTRLQRRPARIETR